MTKQEFCQIFFVFLFYFYILLFLCNDFGIKKILSFSLKNDVLTGTYVGFFNECSSLNERHPSNERPFWKAEN